MLSVWQRTIVDRYGNVVPSASIEVRSSLTGDLVELYADADGLETLDNPFKADARGFAKFYAKGGLYDIAVAHDGPPYSWTNVALGFLGTMDEVTADTITNSASEQESIRNKIGAVGSSEIEHLESASVYQQADHLRRIDFNNSIAVGGGFPTSASEEIRSIYTGGNPDGVLPLQAGNDLAECLILPPTEDSTNFVHPEVPWVMLGGFNRRVLPMDWRTVMYNTPLGLPIFEPVLNNGFGNLVVRYVGDEPIHTILRGTITALIRVGSSSSVDPHSRHILRLRTLDAPQLEMGENGGTRSLASSVAAFDDAKQIKDYWEFNDLCFPLTEDIIQLADTNNWPDYYVGSEQGYFNASDSTEELRQDDVDGPVGPEVQTTKWMDVSGEDFLRHCFFLNYTGEGTRRRVQVRMQNGDIRTFSPMTNDAFSARAIYRLPAGTEQVRIYYSGRGSTADNLEFRRMNFITSDQKDPLKGMWVERTFSVCRDVVFWPGAQYYIEVFTQFWGSTAADYGFRLTGGGLSFMFDAGREKKKWADTLFSRVL